MKSPGLALVVAPATLFLATALRADTPAGSAVPPAGSSGSVVAAVADRGQAAPATTSTPASSAVVERAPDSPAPMRRLTQADILKRFDTNGDGKLDADEVAAAHAEMMKVQDERREQRQELKKAGVAPGGKFRQQLLEKFDHNHDGKLDEAERAEARKYAQEHGRGERMRAAGQTMREQLLARFDKNGDGKLDDAEWAEAAPLLRERIQNAPGMMRRFDTNHDGQLDDAEWAAATAQLQRLVNTPPPGTAAAAAQPAAAK